MNKEIDLNNYQIRTDLAIESIGNNKKINQNVEDYDNVKVTNVFLDKDSSKLINKKEGTYITIEFDDITDSDNYDKVKDVFTKKISSFLNTIGIKEDDTCLIIGLGNSKSTPDSLGPLTVDDIIVTSHLFKLGVVSEGFRCVSAISPGVTGQTGIETSDLIKSIVNTSNPSFLIVIDALASSSVERVNKTIQITNTGIHPGSGVGNSRKEISFETIHKPVVAIGVPTVVDAVTIVSDTINYMYKHFSYTKKYIKNPASRLAIGSSNYLKKGIEIDNNDKENLFGLVGKLDDESIRLLIAEVLSPIGYNLMVTPKEVDFIIEKLSSIISSGINHALHKNI